MPAHAVPSTPEQFSRGPRLRLAAFCTLAVLAFGLSYGRSPLYTSNQNQYFLHGAARAGIGFLREDRLANTADPTLRSPRAHQPIMRPADSARSAADADA